MKRKRGKYRPVAVKDVVNALAAHREVLAKQGRVLTTYVQRVAVEVITAFAVARGLEIEPDAQAYMAKLLGPPRRRKPRYPL